MSIRTLLISAFFLAISCVSVQANIDTRLNVPSDTTSQPVLLMAQSYEQDRLDELQDRRDDYYDDDDCDDDDDYDDDDDDDDDYDDDDCDDDDDDCD